MYFYNNLILKRFISDYFMKSSNLVNTVKPLPIITSRFQILTMGGGFYWRSDNNYWKDIIPHLPICLCTVENNREILRFTIDKTNWNKPSYYYTAFNTFFYRFNTDNDGIGFDIAYSLTGKSSLYLIKNKFGKILITQLLYIPYYDG